jgi:hypothetical protein
MYGSIWVNERTMARHLRRERVDTPLPDTSLMTTPDGRYFVVRGRLWRMSNPALPPDVRQHWVDQLMQARREVGAALKAKDATAERTARRAVNEAKIALGERGPVWWSDGSPDYNRRLVKNSPYADWYSTVLEATSTRQ